MSAESSNAKPSKICELCKVNTSKYCCPRCEVLYCSLDCYKSEAHASCSEDFYRDCVNEELTSQHTDEESKRKMLEILKKINGEHNFDEIEDLEFDNEEIDSDDNVEDDLHERIKDINLDDADSVWNVLTEDERNEFEALLNRGDVGSILPQWEPWWTYSKDARLVQDLEDNEEKEVLKKCPSLVKVPKFSTLTTIEPSPAIRYNITNVLSSYAFIMRYFNGELDPVEGTTYLLNTCDNLDNNANFEDPATAVESVAQRCLLSNLIETDEGSLQIMKRDTFFILQGPSEENKLHYCRAALSHLLTLLQKARSSNKCSKIHEQPTKMPKIGDEPTKPPKMYEKPTKLPKIGEKLPKINAKPKESSAETSTSNLKGNKAFSKKFLDQRGDYLPLLDARKLKKCIKKVEFYLSFIESHGMEFEM
ncbi:zinc finger HIT domain-containing protein 2 [Pectinophora gossypiella]|uniref:zinc finger HIT domain-containing protein 2 n=1 Tax=Pectinophora gossypiella TaxID=13191 RepID=UPI00214F4BA6|nr:zinc finger HIT domain-containing protein 2 [Pectinophora gossypiella]